MLWSDRLKNYFTEINSANLMATCVKRGRWSITFRKTGRSSARDRVESGVSITNSTTLSNAFNDNFSIIGSKLASEIPFNNGSSFQEYVSGQSERFQFVSADSNQVLSLFKRSWSRWNIQSAYPWLRWFDCTLYFISIIFNSSLANGIFPDDWKSAMLSPLFKHGERNDVGNYRPISGISKIGKVFERNIYNQLFRVPRDSFNSYSLIGGNW